MTAFHLYILHCFSSMEWFSSQLMKKTSNSKDKKNVANYFLSEFENVLTSNGPEFFRRKKLFLKTFMYNI